MAQPDDDKPEKINIELTVELYKASRESVKHYDDLRWKRLSTYLYSTALLFAGVGFTQKYLHSEIMSFIILSVGFLFTTCFLIIEYRSAEPLIGWVKEAHRLEKLLGGGNEHVKSRMAIRQRHAFRIMYGLFALGWLLTIVLTIFIDNTA
jgi:hypothetical protein